MATMRKQEFLNEAKPAREKSWKKNLVGGVGVATTKLALKQQNNKNNCQSVAPFNSSLCVIFFPSWIFKKIVFFVF